MVNSRQSRKRSPQYRLEDVRALAKAEELIQGSRTVQRDSENLGYGLVDICQCVAGLSEENFLHSIKYASSSLWMDVYCIRWPSPEGHVDPLYIKLYLHKASKHVVLNSFHRER